MKRQPSTSGIARVLSRKRASGFTLIEILCATFAAAIVLVAVYQIFQQSVKTRDHATDRVHETRLRDRAAKMVRNDLINAYLSGGVLANTMEGGAQSQKSRFPGYLRFTTTTGKNSADDPYGDVQQVEYYIEEAADSTTSTDTGNFVRAVTRDLLATVQDSADEQQVLSRIQSFEVTFFDGQNWQDTWQLDDTTTTLPQAIRVRLQQTAVSEHIPTPPPLEILVPLNTQPPGTSTASTTGTTAAATSPTPTPSPSPSPTPRATTTPSTR